MKLPKKILILLGLAFASLFGALSTAASVILWHSIKQAEQENTRQGVKGVLSVMTQIQEDFSSRFADWSAWDDTYAFVKDVNKNYIASNLVPTALLNLKINLVLFVEPSGRIVYGTGFDRINQRKTAIPAALRTHLSPQNRLLQHPHPESSLTGILLLPEGPMLIASRPIVTSEGRGPIRGTIIFGRYLSADEINKLYRSARLRLSVHGLNETQMPLDFQTARHSLSIQNQILVSALNEDIIAGYVMLPDIYGKPAVLLRVDFPREISKQGQNTRRYLVVSLLIVGLFFGAIILILLQRLVTFLKQRQQAEVALRQAQTKYYGIFNNAVVGIFQTTVDGQYISVNKALAQIYGYESPEALITSLTDIGRQLYVDPQRRNQFITLMQQHESICEFESQVYRKDGRIIWISEDVRAVQSSDNQLYYEGFVQDITYSKQTEAALRESEERYAFVIRGTSDGIWDWNLKTNEVYFSQRWKAMLGFRDNEISSSLEEWYNRVHLEDILPLKQKITDYLRGITTDLEDEYRICNQDGAYLWVLCRGFVIRDADNAYRLVGSQTDISKRKQAEEKLLHYAFHDPLTGLANRALFIERLEHSIKLVKRHENHLFAVLFLDLDRFKVINDSLGHMVGDQLLIALTQRLKRCLRGSDTFARLGGDEFVVLLENIEGDNDVIQVVQRIQQELKLPFNINEHEIFASTSIGVILSTTAYTQAEELLRDADIAMYKAKAQGRGCHQVFDISMHSQAVALMQLETDLQRAILNQEFQLYYQPIVSLRSQQTSGFEALLRWHHPERGLLSPAEFIPLLEETGLIIPIGWWVLREACAQMRTWQKQFPYPPLFISVNLSSKQLAQLDFIEQLQQVLQQTQLDAKSLKLELTESTLIENQESSAAELLLKLQVMDVGLSLDDFGTGYSSLSYLHRFRLDMLKIDRSFIHNVDSDLEKLEILRTIITLAWNLGMDVVAEGVETKKQMYQLQSLKCKFAQGYLFSKPLNKENVELLLAQDFQKIL